MDYGTVFVPTPNQVTTVALNFRMPSVPMPAANDFTTPAAQDRVGLEVADPNTPIPEELRGRWETIPTCVPESYSGPEPGIHLPAPCASPQARCLLRCQATSAFPCSG